MDMEELLPSWSAGQASQYPDTDSFSRTVHFFETSEKREAFLEELNVNETLLESVRLQGSRRAVNDTVDQLNEMFWPTLNIKFSKHSTAPTTGDLDGDHPLANEMFPTPFNTSNTAPTTGGPDDENSPPTFNISDTASTSGGPDGPILASLWEIFPSSEDLRRVQNEKMRKKRYDEDPQYWQNRLSNKSGGGNDSGCNDKEEAERGKNKDEKMEEKKIEWMEERKEEERPMERSRRKNEVKNKRNDNIHDGRKSCQRSPRENKIKSCFKLWRPREDTENPQRVPPNIELPQKLNQDILSDPRSKFCKYAIIFGSSIENMPSDIFIIVDLYNDKE